MRSYADILAEDAVDEGIVGDTVDKIKQLGKNVGKDVTDAARLLKKNRAAKKQIAPPPEPIVYRGEW